MPRSHKAHKYCVKGTWKVRGGAAHRPLGPSRSETLTWRTPSETPSKTPGPPPAAATFHPADHGEDHRGSRGQPGRGAGGGRGHLQEGSFWGVSRREGRGHSSKGDAAPRLSGVFDVKKAGGQGEGKKHGGNRGDKTTWGHGRARAGTEAQGHPATQHRAETEGTGKGPQGLARPPSSTARDLHGKPADGLQRAQDPRQVHSKPGIRGIRVVSKTKQNRCAQRAPHVPPSGPRSVLPSAQPSAPEERGEERRDGTRLAGLAAEACSSLRPRSASRYSANYGAVCHVILIHVSCLESRLQCWALGQDRGQEGRGRNLPLR